MDELDNGSLRSPWQTTGRVGATRSETVDAVGEGKPQRAIEGTKRTVRAD